MAETVLKSEDTKQFIVIKQGKEKYGINISYIHNIVRIQSITRVPKAPKYMTGVINLRGEIIPVMSLRLRFGLQAEPFTNTTRIIIVKVSGQAIGIIVDEVEEVINLRDTDMEMIIKDATDEKANYISGVGKVGTELVTLLNIEGFIVVSN
ncbi:MAG: chemotaxis protein CheW [Vallitaleaceae bacterium]|jgi:purine-binding chemotaxis protein CheW|nr:chemotaxis protein CheW [Vallitaleaceae bacterium]